MYFQLSESLKRKFIWELRRFWQYHPKYRDVVDHIQGKFSFEERPQYGIVVKNSGGSQLSMSADNYRGIVESYVYKALFKNHPGVAVEWVREDALAVQNNGGRFPSPPGVYYLDLTEDNVFYVDRLLEVTHEQVVLTDGRTGQLQHAPLDQSIRLYEMPSGFLLVEDTNYTVSDTGVITLNRELNKGQWLSADYRYPGETTGPHNLTPMYANNTVIPGVVIAFGRRNEKGDRVAIVVQDVRQPAAQEYGGRWNLSLDFDITARDVYAQQELYDQTVQFVWGVLKNRMSDQGVEIIDISLGGESEEIYDENGDDHFYNAAFSLTVETEWAIWMPLTRTLRQAAAWTHTRAGEVGNMTDEEVQGQVCDIKEIVEAVGLEQVVDPFFFIGNGFEVIK